MLLREAVRDPRVSGLVSVTHVDVSPDLQRAHAYVSVLGTEEERESTMRALRGARPFLRRELAHRLKLRRTPDLDFVSDTTMKRAQELTNLMRQNARERGEEL